MTMLTHSSNWETVRADVWVKRGKANRPSLSRVVLFSSLRWSHRIRLSDLDQNFSPSSPMRVLLGMLFFLGLVERGRGYAGIPTATLIDDIPLRGIGRDDGPTGERRPTS